MNQIEIRLLMAELENFGESQTKYRILWDLLTLPYCVIRQAVGAAEQQFLMIDYTSDLAPDDVQEEMNLWLSSEEPFPAILQRSASGNVISFVLSEFQGVPVESFLATAGGFLKLENLLQLSSELLKIFRGLFDSQVEVQNPEHIISKIFYLRDGRMKIVPTPIYRLLLRNKELPLPIRSNVLFTPASEYLKQFGMTTRILLTLLSNSETKDLTPQLTVELTELFRLADRLSTGEFQDFQACEVAFAAFRKHVDASQKKTESASVPKATPSKPKVKAKKQEPLLIRPPIPKVPSWFQRSKFLRKLMPPSTKIGLYRQAVLLQQLAVMVRVGISLVRALDILSIQEENPKLKKALQTIRSQVAEGTTFSKACSGFPEIFPDTILLLMKVGEETGTLGERLQGGAELLERWNSMMSQVKQAITGPLFTTSIFILFFFATGKFILPQFVSFFKQLDVHLPFFSKFVLFMIKVMNSPILLVVIVAAAVLFYKFKAQIKEWLFLEGLKLSFPRKLIGKVLGAQFCNVVAFLYRDGVSLQTAVEVLEKSTSFKKYSEDLKIVNDGLTAGDPLSDALVAVPYFPKVVSQMLVVGEGTGKIDALLMATAKFMEGEILYTMLGAAAIIEPAAILVLGFVLGTFFIGLLLPLYQLIGQLGQQ